MQNIYDSIKPFRNPASISGAVIKRRKATIWPPPLELLELKLLVDAVQVSRFITESSRQLIKSLSISQIQMKLARFSGRSTSATVLRRKMNIFRNINEIHAALSQNSKVSFQYLECNRSQKLIPKHDGQLYTVSPLTLTWADENYYLIAYAPEHKGIRHYRVDKMKGLRQPAKSGTKRSAAKHSTLPPTTT